MGPVIAALIRAAEGSWIPAGPFFAWGLEGGDFNQSFRIAARPANERVMARLYPTPFVLIRFSNRGSYVFDLRALDPIAMAVMGLGIVILAALSLVS